MAVDIQYFFNEEMPAQIAKYSDQAKQIGAKLQLNVTGEGGGSWFVDAGSLSCRPGDPGGADCTITMDAADFQKFLENPQANVIQLLIGGRMRITGNPMLAQKFGELFYL